LREYLEKRFNKTLTTEIVRQELRDEGRLLLRDWSLIPTLRERLHGETTAYLETHSPFGVAGSIIERPQTELLADQLKEPAGPSIILLTGVAGSGKSGDRGRFERESGSVSCQSGRGAVARIIE
jgi:hypothetical protein